MRSGRERIRHSTAIVLWTRQGMDGAMQLNPSCFVQFCLSREGLSLSETAGAAKQAEK